MLDGVDVISDVVCPWCFIGKRHLDAALARWQSLHPGERPDVRWHAFQLNPDMPVEGMDRQDYVAAKFGGPDRARDIYARVAAAGRTAGIEFDFGRMQIQPNTSQAHRLIAWAGAKGRQDAMVETLFRGYFLTASDLTDDGQLALLAEQAGLDRDGATEFLAGDELRGEVAADERMARSIGVQGVPFFIFNRRLAVSGAQPPEVLIQAMEEASRAPAGAA